MFRKAEWPKICRQAQNEGVTGLLSLVQMGVLEFHPWGSSEKNSEKPDMMTFDLDPSEQVAWKATVHGARLLRKRMDELGLASFLKTSGGKGLHLVIPIRRRTAWKEVKAFAKAVASGMADKSREIDLKRFVKTGDINPVYFERSYYLAPDGNSDKAYRLLAAVMEKKGRAGIATFVMRTREYIVAIISEKGILRAETLRFADEIRSPEAAGRPAPLQNH